MVVRLDRLLANLGYGSRSQVGYLIRAGRVTVDQSVCRDAARRVDPSLVLVDHEPLDHGDGIFVAIHKPLGYVCTHDERDGPTVFTLLPEHWFSRSPRPEAVGRLDKDTSGLLLITDDHGLLHRLTSPKHHVTKTYQVTLDRPADPELIETFAAGTLMLRSETDACLPATLVIGEGNVAEVTLTEGRYHQVKRMFAAVGWHVETLHRTSVGPWTLDGLASGEWADRDPAAR